MDGKPWRCRAACGHRRSAPASDSTPCSAAATAPPRSGRRPKLSDSAVLNILCFFPFFVGVSPRCSQAASQANTYGCVFAFAVLILCGFLRFHCSLLLLKELCASNWISFVRNTYDKIHSVPIIAIPPPCLCPRARGQETGGRGPGRVRGAGSPGTLGAEARDQGAGWLMGVTKGLGCQR